MHFSNVFFSESKENKYLKYTKCLMIFNLDKEIIFHSFMSLESKYVRASKIVQTEINFSTCISINLGIELLNQFEGNVSKNLKLNNSIWCYIKLGIFIKNRSCDLFITHQNIKHSFSMSFDCKKSKIKQMTLYELNLETIFPKHCRDNFVPPCLGVRYRCGNVKNNE